jgi:hypothetical protein
MDWDGAERRKVTLDGLHSEVINLVTEIKSLHVRFDNELGSAKGEEGTVKRHIRETQDIVKQQAERYDKILLGDGITNYGLTSEIKNMRNLKKEVEEHMRSMKWVMGILIPMVLTIMVKIFQ